ncbi:Baculoviral IAP repeat-containing protein 6 [Geodia barretti]|uniref:Baculoviral IAP repeat-containing protein 6 n=1 Tax=Geodia barretti TaxID=519541 RepID=A0AA35SHE2_GEOBA|nr:Baculoviral IAP repeat-containing protein 6 [Geodia barretti]
MEIRNEVSFQLEGLRPAQLCALPAQGSIVVVGSAEELQCLDLTSRTLLNTTRPEPAPSRLLCCHHERSGKLVMVGGGRLGARGPIGGSMMIKTLLQPAREDMEDSVSIELSLSEAEVLWTELERQVLPRNSDLPAGANSKQLTSRLASVTAQLAREVRRALDREGKQPANKWCTVSFEGPVQQLFSLFEHLLNRLRAVRSQGSYTCPSSSATPSPALPVLAAVCLRLRLLHPDLCSPLQQLAEGREMKEQKLANCEAVRRLSLKRWPHKDYLWAAPSAMAEAGFFQVANNPPHLATSAVFKGDRVTCFACHVYLYNWEPHDEPWSEHERHAFQCPFMRGDPTENVPLEVTEGSHPAVQVTAESADEITTIAVSPHSNLVAVATRLGILSIWDIGGSLCILPHAQLRLERKSLQSVLQAHYPRDRAPEEISSFSITSLSLLSFPDVSPSTLITALTSTTLSGSTHSFILVHSVLAPPPAPQDPLTPTPQEADPSQLIPLLEHDKLFNLDPSPSTPPLLSHLTTGTDDTHGTHRGGSLTLLSLLPISTLLPDLHGNLEVWQTHPLPTSRLLAVYVGRPRPPSSTEVKDDINDGPFGCLMMLKCNEAEEGGVSSVPEVRRVTMAEEEGIVDMCHVAMGDSGAMRETLVVVTTGGDFQILDVNSLQVMAVHMSAGGCGFTLCTAWSSSTGSWVAVATREGSMEVVRVCRVGGGGAGGEIQVSLISQKCEMERLSCPLLDQLLSLTETSPVGVVFSAPSPPQWREISLQQFHRKVPTHMHSGRGSGDHTHHTRVWQYLPPSSSTTRPISGDFTFEVCLPSACPPLGCVSVCLSLPAPRCIGDSATLSLLLPLPHHRDGGEATDERRTEALCGPISLRPLVDVTGCVVQVRGHLLQQH